MHYADVVPINMVVEAIQAHWDHSVSESEMSRQVFGALQAALFPVNCQQPHWPIITYRQAHATITESPLARELAQGLAAGHITDAQVQVAAEYYFVRPLVLALPKPRRSKKRAVAVNR